MDDEEELLRAFREELEEIEERITAHNVMRASGSLLRSWCRDAYLESITGRHPDGSEITAYADGTVTGRLDADGPEVDITAVIDEHERRVKKSKDSERRGNA